ncbi:MAG: hypothetical protein NW215_06800 [Hyphomicrobiales bacterium]|nr:hypothetical protein [Hyphomicrobiales bacterium]
MTVERAVVALNREGEGVAEDATIIPGGLPGERFGAPPGQPLSRLTSSPERQPPVCPHFGVCGGCAAQHMSAALYGAWKQGLVVDALARRGLPAHVGALWRAPDAARRRAVLTAQRVGGRVLLGYHRRRSHDLVDVQSCPVLRPEIVAALPALRAAVSPLVQPGHPVQVHVLACDNGLDVALSVARRLTRAERSTAAEKALGLPGLVRLTLNGEELARLAAPRLVIDGVAVEPPPGAFVQAVAEAEREMAARVASALTGAKRAADLFCGLGAFTFPLARHMRVAAADSDASAVAALSAAARKGVRLKPVSAMRRDLFRAPFSAAELNAYDAVVFDPPRAGAAAQASQIAKSKASRVVAVSCNPETFARDAAILVAGGYRMGEVGPIDQFVYSTHVELVAAFER